MARMGWGDLVRAETDKYTFARGRLLARKRRNGVWLMMMGVMEGEREWKECPGLDARQFFEPRLFYNRSGGPEC